MSLFEQMAALQADRVPFVVATVVDTGGSTPRLAGAQMLIHAAGIAGTIGGGAFEHHIIQEAHDLLESNQPTATVSVHLTQALGMCCGGQMQAFLNTHRPTPRLLIYGAGHVGTALAILASQVDFAVTVVDARSAWADATRFPDAVTVIDADPEDHARALVLAPDVFPLIVTHDHGLDERLVQTLAPHAWRFLGLIGSRRKWAMFRQRLIARGLTSDALDRVRCPVGLDIGAQTPMEIAVSILGALVAVRRS